MRLPALLACVSACGFAPTVSVSSDDARSIDVARGDGVVDGSADGAPDAPPDAPPTWQVIDTLIVPCSGTPVTSTASLTATGTYHVRALGECVVNTANDSRSDAEYFGYNVNQFADIQSNVDNGISIDNTTLGPTKAPRWGTYTNTHVYEVPWAGVGAPISATYFDSNYPNNTGSLTLEIVVYQ